VDARGKPAAVCRFSRACEWRRPWDAIKRLLAAQTAALPIAPAGPAASTGLAERSAGRDARPPNRIPGHGESRFRPQGDPISPSAPRPTTKRTGAYAQPSRRCASRLLFPPRQGGFAASRLHSPLGDRQHGTSGQRRRRVAAVAVLLYSSFVLRKRTSRKTRRSIRRARARSTVKIAIGERVRALREAGDLSRADLAELMGTHRTNVYRLEQGRRSMPLYQAIRLADALDVTLDQLVGRKTREQHETMDAPPALLRRAERIHRLPVAQRRAILDVIDAYLDQRSPTRRR